MQSHKHGKAVSPLRWGIFLRRPCRRLNLGSESPHFRPMTALYDSLKKLGFRETYWQYVYLGQVGGLVKTPQRSIIEIHVRFFDNGTMYTEIEFCRSALLHFINRRQFANNYVASLLMKKVSPDTHYFFMSSTENYKISSGAVWPEWGFKDKFITPKIKLYVQMLAVISDWRSLFLIMLSSVYASIDDRGGIFPLFVAAMILLYVLAPKRR